MPIDFNPAHVALQVAASLDPLPHLSGFDVQQIVPAQAPRVQEHRRIQQEEAAVRRAHDLSHVLGGVVGGVMIAQHIAVATGVDSTLLAIPLAFVGGGVAGFFYRDEHRAQIVDEPARGADLV